MLHRAAGLAAIGIFAVYAALTPAWRRVSNPACGGSPFAAFPTARSGPPQQSTRCLTAEQAQDLATTFSPVSKTVNSTCAPLEREFAGGKLTWRLVCKGQLDMEITGEFHFDGPRHYTATTTTKAMMAGQTMVDSRDLLDANWESECR